MQLKHIRSLANAREAPYKVLCIAWARSGARLAVATSDRVVHLYDDAGEKREKFATKSMKGKDKKFTVTSMAFSPDSSKLAIAQSDDSLFVYKLGLEWGEQKSIAHKFSQSSAITTIAWPREHLNDIVMGLAEGAVKIANLKRGKAAPLYESESPVLASCTGPDGHSVLLAHLDGTLCRFTFPCDETPAQRVTFNNPCPPLTVSWGETILVTGPDLKIRAYDVNGRMLHQLDYSREPNETCITAAAMSPSGTSVVLGSHNTLRLLLFSPKRNRWEEASTKVIENLYTVSALAWNTAGTQLLVGSLCGGLELFDACLRRARYKGEFEFTYVSSSQVLVARLGGAKSDSVLLKSSSGADIDKINIFKGRYVVAHLADTLILADLANYLMSEIPWSGGGNEKCFFDNPRVCMVFNAGELTIVEYGKADVLGVCRTEFMSPHRISIRLADGPTFAQPLKRIAYLIDAYTIRVQDLVSGMPLATLTHDTKVDWLELSRHGTNLLFRDKRRHLFLVPLDGASVVGAGAGSASSAASGASAGVAGAGAGAASTAAAAALAAAAAAAAVAPGAAAGASAAGLGEKTTLLSYCSYAQWVPDADVIVAQNRNTLCVWYSIGSPERVSTFAIKGDVDTITRSAGKTEVVIQDGMRTRTVQLDEGLIEFGASLEDRDYGRAIAMLETLPDTPESQAMWQALAGMALADSKLTIAQRCYAALGDVARAQYLRSVLRVAQTQDDGTASYAVQAKLLVLKGRPREAETLLLRYGGETGVADAMQMWQELVRHEEAIRVASENAVPHLAEFKEQFVAWLAETRQYARAAHWKANEGLYSEAIALYLKGGLPARAAALVAEKHLSLGADVLERIGAALFGAGLYAKAGELFEQLGNAQQALDSYRRGRAYAQAIALARAAFPKQVAALEDECGDWLVERKQLDAAINHFVEAGKYEKALAAALQARQFTKALQLLATLPPAQVAAHALSLAQHFERKADYARAEELYLRAASPRAAVAMYAAANRFADVQRLASHLAEGEVTALFLEQAARLQSAGKLADAERLYVDVQQPDEAIQMYKNAGKYDDMLRLVATYHKDLVVNTHLSLAQKLEAEGRYGEAEKHYVAGGEWKDAVNMHRTQNAWEDAYRVACTHGPESVANQVAYYWIRSVSLPPGLVSKLGLAAPAVRFALDSGEWSLAVELATAHAAQHPGLLAEVHLKHACMLEESGAMAEAEAAYIRAGRPREAILMHAHAKDWSAAVRVAREHDPSALKDILIAQGRAAAETGAFADAEQLFLRADSPAAAADMYRKAGDWKEALRVVKRFLPNQLGEYQAEYEAHVAQRGSQGKDGILAQAKVWQDQGEFNKAIDCYLKLNSSLTKDFDALEVVWMRELLPLALKFVPTRVNEVVSFVARSLVGMKRVDVAADVYAGVELYKEAVDVYLEAGMFREAGELAARRAPHLRDYVAEAKRKHLVQAGKADQLLQEGDWQSACELMATQGRWDEALALAARQGPDVLTVYTTQRADQLVNAGDFRAAVAMYARYAPLPLPKNLPLYVRIAKEVLFTLESESVAGLKQMLMTLLRGLETTPLDDAGLGQARALHRACIIAHLVSLKRKYESASADFQPLHAKTSVALLRYAGDMPADRVFYEAGAAAIKAGWQNAAFAIWNRYIDISDALKEGELGEADVFRNSDVPSARDLLLVDAAQAFVPAKEVERVRDWVLERAMERMEADLPQRRCEQCSQSIFAASLTCPHCQHEAAMCIVTGYPLGREPVAQCRACSMRALKDDWNRFVLKENKCAWCAATQSLSFE